MTINKRREFLKTAGSSALFTALGTSFFLSCSEAEETIDEISDDEISTLKNFKKVFINPEIIEETGSEWDFKEGCLSIPNVREDITRKEKITIRYYDESFKEIELTLDGLAARIVQHEYDHIEGVLFTDKLSSLKKKLIRGKLNDISNGKIKTEYKMIHPKGKIKK